MNWKFFQDLLSIDSTTGKEREVALWLLDVLEAPSKQSFEVGDGTLNLLLSWGTPQVVFCTHMDTVPPYLPCRFEGGSAPLLSPCGSRPISPPSSDTASAGRSDEPIEGGSAPLLSPCGSRPISPPSSDTASAGRSDERLESFEAGLGGEGIVWGRGANDAKGQLFALYTACKELEAEGCTDFGLLLLSGEETGSWGAKAFARTDFRAPFLIVGEPTENKMVSASKGTLSYTLSFKGEAFHSGYPQYGVSAVDLFHQFYNALKDKDFGLDPELGETTWNVGLLRSDNPQNILSPELTCRLYFRTTFLSHQAVQDWMKEMTAPGATPAALVPSPAPDSGMPAPAPALAGRLTATRNGSGDVPAHYVTLPGLPSAPVAFGSDAPHLSNFGHKIICGPGSIRTAHRSDEHVLASELETAVRQYKQMYHALMPGTQPIEP